MQMSLSSRDLNNTYDVTLDYAVAAIDSSSFCHHCNSLRKSLPLSPFSLVSVSRCYGLQPPSTLLPLAAHRHLTKLDVFGIMSGEALTQFSKHFRRQMELNRCYFSYVARPTPWDPPRMRNRGGDLTQIWGVKTNDAF